MAPQPTRRSRYWLKNTRLTVGLLAVWFVVTFVAGYFAENLNQFTFLGFPLGFYLFAQGSVLIFIAIVAIYVRYMNRLDEAWAHESPGQLTIPGHPGNRVAQPFDDTGT